MVVAICVAISIAGIAWRTGHLGIDGAVAASVVGTIVFHSQLSWATLLIVWFVAASVVSRIGRTHKYQRTAHMVAKHDRRDAWQVIANGGVFVALACIPLRPGITAGHVLVRLTVDVFIVYSWFAIAAAGALSAAAADTFATEIGTLGTGEP